MDWFEIINRLVSMATDVVILGMVLGYPLRSSKGIGAGCLWMGFASVILPELLAPVGGAIAVDGVLVAMAATGVFFYRKVEAGMLFALLMGKLSAGRLNSGLVTAIWKIPVSQFDDRLPYALCIELVWLGIFLGAGFLLGTRRQKIQRAIKGFPQWVYAISFLFMCVSTINFETTSPYEEDILLSEGMEQASQGICGILLFVTGILALCIWHQKKELARIDELNQRCIRQLTEQYRRLDEQQKELRRFRHDYANHLKVLYQLVETGDMERFRSYLAEIAKPLQNTRRLTTGNPIGDAVLNHYYALAAAKDVHLKLIGTFLPELKIGDVDLCVILTNLLSNGLEAAEGCKRPATITVELSGYEEKMQCITVTNPVKERPDHLKEGKWLFSTKDNMDCHGLGLLNVEDVLLRCGGRIRYCCVENTSEESEENASELLVRADVSWEAK